MAIRTDRKVYDKLVTELDTTVQSLKTTAKNNFGVDVSNLKDLNDKMSTFKSGIELAKNRPFLLKKLDTGSTAAIEVIDGLLYTVVKKITEVSIYAFLKCLQN